MSSACPRSRELSRLLDGEVTENRAGELRGHLASCRACVDELERQQRLLADIAAPVPGVASEGALQALMRRVDTAEASVRPHLPGDDRLKGLLGLVAVATALALAIVLLPRAGEDRGEFSARGANVAWSRKVGVELWALEGTPRRLSPGDRLAPGVALVGTFSNLDPAPAYLLAFALDSRGEVRWLYPAFTDPRSDPVSVRLEASVVQRVLPETVILEDVAPGALRFVFVLSREPRRVSSIESATVPDRDPSALRARWPDARVDDLLVSVASSAPAVP
jgi:Putative zinc-finger